MDVSGSGKGNQALTEDRSCTSAHSRRRAMSLGDTMKILVLKKMSTLRSFLSKVLCTKHTELTCF